MIQLTPEIVSEFIGGQMEIQNESEGYIYRGEIKTITVENNELRAEFIWLAKGEGSPPLPDRWVKDERLDYMASLDIYSVSNIGPTGNEIGGSDRISLLSPIVGELVILYPPDGSKLDPSKVEGLDLQTTTG